MSFSRLLKAVDTSAWFSPLREGDGCFFSANPGTTLKSPFIHEPGPAKAF